MAIAPADHNQAPRRASAALVDRWTLTGTSPCACTRGGRVLR